MWSVVARFIAESEISESPQGFSATSPRTPTMIFKRSLKWTRGSMYKKMVMLSSGLFCQRIRGLVACVESEKEKSLDCCELDCKELMRASCKIYKSGIGGPLVNCFGEVIGVNFFHERYTPFMPINLVSKWLEHFKKHGRFCRPWLGMEVANLYAAPVNKLETIIQNFPNIFKGVIVEKVVRGSPAGRAGLLRGDVIVQCNQTFVLGVLEVTTRINHIDEPFYYKSNANKDVNVDAKRAALKVSALMVRNQFLWPWGL